MICDFDVCYRTSYRLRVGCSRFDKIDELPNTTPMTIDDGALGAGSILIFRCLPAWTGSVVFDLHGVWRSDRFEKQSRGQPI